MKIRAVQYLFSKCLYQQAIIKVWILFSFLFWQPRIFIILQLFLVGPAGQIIECKFLALPCWPPFLIWTLVYFFYIQSYTVSVAFLWSPGSLSILLWPLTSTMCLCPHSLLDLLISGTILCKYLIWLLMKIQVNQQLRHQQCLKSLWSSLAGGQDGITQWLHMVAATIFFSLFHHKH